MAVEDDAGAGFLAKPPRREFLQVGIDREAHRRAAAVRLGLELAHQLAARR